MEYAYHSLVPLLGIAIAGLTLFGAIAIGPYGQRSMRLLLATVSFAAVLGVAFWFITYLDVVEQRRSIETRLSELRGQALSAGSPLACLERTGDLVEAGCAQTLFATPETLAAAKLYTAARLDLLVAATRYYGPRTPQFDDAIAAMKRSLQHDPFGLTAHSLMLRESCSPERCDLAGSFPDSARVLDNIRQKTFDTNVASYGGAWRTQAMSPAPRAPSTQVAAPVALVAPTDTEGSRTPIPDKYTLPSASSIPPVSIMNDEPAERPTKERAASPPPRPVAAAPSPSSDPAPAPQASTPPAEPAATEKQAPRRDKGRTAAPLSIVPTTR